MFIEKIKENGYKITKTREAILNVLFYSENKMITADFILKNSKKMCENINITTVYRNLEILEALNIVHRITADSGVFLYKLYCNDIHHHHLICNFCGKVEVIDFCPLKSFKKISKNKKFHLIDHKLELYGICEKCIKLKNKKS
jgi:Fur family zinc uptake transcriptional regulator/Fur family ferric uptake transcriptional regulator